MEHKDIPSLQMHRPHNWVVFDQAALAALEPTLVDVGKYAWVETDNTEWVLVSAEPVLWKERVGEKGPKGDTGEQGIQGPKGDTGGQGPKGDKGDAADALVAVLTGLVTSDASGVLASDTILQALGKLQAQTSNKVDKVEGKQLSTEDYTSTEKTKLGGIAAGATANAPDADLRDRATHTGTQAISTVTGLQTALDAKADNSAVAQAIDMAATFTAVPTTFQAPVIFVTQPHPRVMQWDGTKYVRAPWHAPGKLSYFLRDVPAGHIEVRSDVVLNKADFPDLAEYLGVTAETFTLDETRGEFLRTLDSGRGVDVGRTVGSAQGDAIRNITGSISRGLFAGADTSSGVFAKDYFADQPVKGSEIFPTHGYTFDASRQVPTAAENRPRNLAYRLAVQY